MGIRQIAFLDSTGGSGLVVVNPAANESALVWMSIVAAGFALLHYGFLLVSRWRIQHTSERS